MTDIIHEQPKEETNSGHAPQTDAAEEALDEHTGQRRVYGYIFILFTVAFSLLLWSFLMNQRSNEQVISELRGSADSLQSTLERNIELEKKVDELEMQLSALREEKKALEDENAAVAQERETLTQTAAAYALLDQLSYFFAQEDFETCRALADALAPMQDLLSDESDAVLAPVLGETQTAAEAKSARAHYQDIVDALRDDAA